MKADLDEKHGQHAILRNMVCDSGVNNDLAPEGAFLGVHNDGENGGNLHGEDEPALCFLKLDERGGDGDGGAGLGRCVGPEHCFDAAGDGFGLP